jgi:hypothetical protein
MDCTSLWTNAMQCMQPEPTPLTALPEQRSVLVAADSAAAVLRQHMLETMLFSAQHSQTLCLMA